MFANVVGYQVERVAVGMAHPGRALLTVDSTHALPYIVTCGAGLTFQVKGIRICALLSRVLFCWHCI